MQTNPTPDALVEMLRECHDYGYIPARTRALVDAAADTLAAMQERIERLEAENARLRQDVIAFAGPCAANYAREHDLPKGHLHPAHYDILANAGARMDSWTRAALGRGE